MVIGHANVNITGPSAEVDAVEAVLLGLFEAPKAGDVFRGEVVLTREYGAFLKLKPLYAGVLTKDKWTNGYPTTGQTLLVRVTEVNDQGQAALELVQETERGVSAVKPTTVTMDELLDHLNGMSKLISAKIGQRVVLAAYVIAE